MKNEHLPKTSIVFPSNGNRRELLRGLGLTIGASSLVGINTRSVVGAPATRRMTVALTPGSIGVSVRSQRELNELAYQHKFESVEPRTEEIAASSTDQLSETLADLKSKNLVWAAAGLPIEFRKDEATFREGIEKLHRLAAGLQRAGVTRVGTWLSPSHNELTYKQNMTQHAARLRTVASILKDHGMRLGLEYVGTQLLLVGKRYPFLHTMAETKDLIAEIGTGNVGFVLDSWHWWTARDTESDLLSLTAVDIVSVDLNDAPKDVPKEQQKDNERELPVSTGIIDAGVFLSALHKLGYDGPVRCEPFNAALNQLENNPACAAVSAAMHKAMGLIY
jgi:sugar phosphate isomerase/epimerase